MSWMQLANLVICFQSIPTAAKTRLLDIPICNGGSSERILKVVDDSLKVLDILWQCCSVCKCQLQYDDRLAKLCAQRVREVANCFQHWLHLSSWKHVWRRVWRHYLYPWMTSLGIFTSTLITVWREERLGRSLKYLQMLSQCKYSATER